MSKSSAGFMCLFLIISTSVYSQSDVDSFDDFKFSLLDYIERHPSVLKMESGIAEAESAVEQSYILFFPFQIQTGASVLLNPEGVTGDGYISMSYDVVDIGQVSSYRKQKVLIEASRTLILWQKQILLYNLLNEILDYKEAQVSVRLSMQHLESLQQSNEAAVKRFDLGVLTKTEYDYALSREAAARASLLKERLLLERIGISLEGSLAAGFKPFWEYAPFLSGDPDWMTEEGITDPVEHRADLIQLRLLMDSTEQDLKGVRSSTIPDFSVTAGGYRLISEKPEFRLSLGMSIPLGAAFYDTAREQEIFLSREAMLTAYTQRQEEARILIMQSLALLRSYKEIQEEFRSAVEYSSAALEGMTKEYQSGFKTLFELLGAQASHYNLVHKLEEAKIEYGRALLDLYFYTGRLKIEDLMVPAL